MMAVGGGGAVMWSAYCESVTPSLPPSLPPSLNFIEMTPGSDIQETGLDSSLLG